MSRNRQSAKFDPGASGKGQVTTLSRDYAAGHVIPLHFHHRDQLVYASRGVMTVRTGVGTWVVPTHRAVWIPAPVAHSITMSGTVSMRTLYLRPRLARKLPRSCCVVNISPLLRELVLHACALATLNVREQRQRHVIDLILDHLETIQMVSLQLPNPTDARALRMAEVLLANPGEQQTLTRVCKIVGAGRRTIERKFLAETGMTVGKWRQQLRLMQAMRLLAEGAKITHAALEAGYSTPSAFIFMFRKTLGTTPSAYFRAGAGLENHPRRASGARKG
jgi:AraC-like DNA-binding protein